MKALAFVALLVPAVAVADVAKLEKVDTEQQPLKLSAPAGWEVRTSPVTKKDLATMAVISARCAAGPDISVMIQLDQVTKTPATLLADQYQGVKSRKLHGWDCIASAPHTEVMCAGKVKGLDGIVSVYFATTSDASYKRFGDPSELTSRIAASLAWSGKLADLGDWKREATADAKAACN